MNLGLGKMNPGLRRETNLLCCPDPAADHCWTRKTVTKTSWNCSGVKTQNQDSNWSLNWKQTISTADYCYWKMSWKQTVSTADCCYWKMGWKQTASTVDYWRMSSGCSTDKPEGPN